MGRYLVVFFPRKDNAVSWSNVYKGTFLFAHIPFYRPIEFLISSPNGPLPVPISSLLHFVIPWPLFTLMENHILSTTLKILFKQFFNALSTKFSNNSKMSQLAQALLLKSTEQLLNKT
jgi:hypothetical protein